MTSAPPRSASYMSGSIVTRPSSPALATLRFARRARLGMFSKPTALLRCAFSTTWTRRLASPHPRS